jgi:hypothetical protein
VTGRVAEASLAGLCDLAFAEGEWNSCEQMRVEIGEEGSYKWGPRVSDCRL